MTFIYQCLSLSWSSLKRWGFRQSVVLCLIFIRTNSSLTGKQSPLGIVKKSHPISIIIVIENFINLFGLMPIRSNTFQNLPI